MEQKQLEAALALTSAGERASALKKFTRDFPESEHKPRALESLVGARAALGDEMLQSNRTAEGVALFELAVEEAPQPIPERLFTGVVSKFPSNLFFRGQTASALKIAGMIEKKAAGNAGQLLNLASFYLGVEGGSDARRLAEAAIQIDPASVAAYQTLGLAHRLNFDLEDSAKAYIKALELDPASAASTRSLAEMKRALGKSDEAVELYRSILDKNEGDLPARTGLILSLFDAGKKAEAESEMARSLEQTPKNLNLLAGAAYWYAAQGDGEKSMQLAQKAIELEPRFIWSHIALTRALMSQNKPIEAERALVLARRFGNFPTLEYEIAAARLAAGFYREAVEELQKSFVLKDGRVKTKLGGRVEREEKSFADLIAYERRASIFEPLAADNAESAAKLKVLFEMDQKLRAAEPNEAEITLLVDEFVSGSDKMKLHRQLHAASLLLQKKIALDKVLELSRAAVGNTDSGLEVSSPAAAVMANELYESRTIAFSRNEIIVVPDVPRQTLSAILRGRIEELAGWTFYQQNSFPEAVVRLRRAISVLPDKSAWWRSTMWRLGAALESDGKDKEALDSYIQSYKNDKPDPLKYVVVETLYKKINGSADGLETQIGANPLPSFVAREPEKQLAAPVKTAEIVENKAVIVPPAANPVEAKTENASAQPPSAIVVPESVPAETAKEAVAEPPAQTVPKYDEALKSATTEPEQMPKSEVTSNPPETPPAAPAKVEPAPEAAIPKIDAVMDKPVPADIEASDEKVQDAETLEEDSTKIETLKTGETAIDPSIKTAAEPESITIEKVVPTDPPVKIEPPIENSLIKQEPVTTTVPPDPVPKTETSSEEPETRQEPVLVPEIKIDPAVEEPEEKAKISEPPAETAPKPEPVKVPDKLDETENDEPETQPSKSPFDDPELSPASKSPPASLPRTKAVLIVEDLLTGVQKPKSSKPKSPNPLFEPVIINVPSAQREIEQPADSQSARASLPAGASRVRIIDGLEIKSDRRCSIELSQDSISILNGGGSLGILVAVKGDGDIRDIVASSSSPDDVDVKLEPEIGGITGRRFYIVKSISTAVGLYQAAFESPCGKRELAVSVR